MVFWGEGLIWGGYLGEAYSVTGPITRQHHPLKKMLLLFHWGNEVIYFVISHIQDYFPVLWGNMVEGVQMPEGTEQERAHPARAGAGLPPLYCTSRCLRVGQLKMFLQSICRRWYDQRHFSSTVQSFPQPNGLATQTPAHPQDKEHPDWSKFISKETLGSF